ncbi:MAG: hypothetical protein KQH79_11275 [Bacteroidetes bacterium]|nr:hypothetical protein [Bacteroidota bacterium]
MKNSLYVISGLLIIIWAIVFYGFNSSGMVHLLLFLAIFIIVVRLLFNQQLSKKYVIFKEKITKKNIQ